jgi:hypothetical protein
VDGWRIVNNENVTVDVLAKGIRLTSPGTDGGIRQYIENGALYEGKVLTFAAKIDGQVYWATGAVPPVPASGLAWIASASGGGNRFSIQLILDTSGYIFVVIQANGAGTILVEFAELVNGKTPLLLGPEEPAIELARCHRTLWVCRDTIHRYPGVRAIGDTIDFPVPLPVAMRANPVFVNAGATAYDSNTVPVSGGTFSIAGGGTDMPILRYTKAGAGFSGGWLQITPGSAFNAEI